MPRAAGTSISPVHLLRDPPPPPPPPSPMGAAAGFSQAAGGNAKPSVFQWPQRPCTLITASAPLPSGEQALERSVPHRVTCMATWPRRSTGRGPGCPGGAAPWHGAHPAPRVYCPRTGGPTCDPQLPFSLSTKRISGSSGPQAPSKEPVGMGDTAEHGSLLNATWNLESRAHLCPDASPPLSLMHPNCGHVSSSRYVHSHMDPLAHPPTNSLGKY